MEFWLRLTIVFLLFQATLAAFEEPLDKKSFSRFLFGKALSQLLLTQVNTSYSKPNSYVLIELHFPSLQVIANNLSTYEDKQNACCTTFLRQLMSGSPYQAPRAPQAFPSPYALKIGQDQSRFNHDHKHKD